MWNITSWRIWKALLFAQLFKNIFFLILSMQWLRLNLPHTYIIAIFPVNNLFISFTHFPMGSLVIFVLIYLSSVNEKERTIFLFGSEKDGFLLIFWGFCWEFCCCSQEKQIFRDRAFIVPIVYDIEQDITLDKWLANLFVLQGLFRNAVLQRRTSLKSKGSRPLEEWVITRHRGTSRPPWWRDQGFFSERVSLWKKTKWNSYLAFFFFL